MVRSYFIIPEFLYMFLLLGSWIAAMFTGIAFVYGIHMKKEKRSNAIWGAVFAMCLLLVFLLMNGFIVAETLLGS